LSSHADGDEIIRWIDTAEKKPGRVFVVHGEEESAKAMAGRITERFGAQVTVPSLKDSFEI